MMSLTHVLQVSQESINATLCSTLPLKFSNRFTFFFLLYVKSSVWSVREAASMHDSAFHFRFKLKLHRKQQSIACLFVSPLLLCFQCCSCSYHHYYILIFNTAHSFTGIWSLMDNFCSIQTYSITSDSCLGCQYCSASLLFLKCIYRGEKAAGQG